MKKALWRTYQIGAWLGFALILVAILLRACPAQAQEQCISPEQVIDHITSQNPQHEIGHVDLGDDQRALFLKNYNAAGTPTDYQADRIMVMAVREVPTVGVYGFKDGCLEFAAELPLKVFVDMINITKGDQEVEGL
jgi:hypothetical protein